MFLSNYLGMVHESEKKLAEAYREVAEQHGDEPDVHAACLTLAKQCEAHADKLRPNVDRYGEQRDQEVDRLYSDLFKGTRQGGLAPLRDLQDLYLMASEVDITWTVLKQAAQGLQDKELLGVVSECEGETSIQLKCCRPE